MYLSICKANLFLSDNEKLPPMLLDLLDESNIEIYHSGCVIAEIRDYRRTLDSSYDTRYVLLQPTSQVRRSVLVLKDCGCSVIVHLYVLSQLISMNNCLVPTVAGSRYCSDDTWPWLDPRGEAAPWSWDCQAYCSSAKSLSITYGGHYK